MAAGLATLRELQKPEVWEQLSARSAVLVGGLREIAAEAEVEFSADSAGGMLGFFFHPGPVTCFADAKNANTDRFRRFFASMLEGGIYLAPSPYEAGFVSSAHRPADISRTLEVARGAMKKAARVPSPSPTRM